MPETMRPREKMLNQGEYCLNEIELLAIILGQGTRSTSAIQLASYLLTSFGGLRGLKEASVRELMEVKGVGIAKAVAVKAAIELGRRISLDIRSRQYIKSPEDVKNMLIEDMRYSDRERFRVLYLDRKGGLICMEDISVGGLNSSIVHPREVFKTAVKNSAASIIAAHNHPSGDPSPSKEDVEVTRRLVEAGNIMGIEVLDHIIIGENSYCSLKAKNLF